MSPIITFVSSPRNAQGAIYTWQNGLFGEWTEVSTLYGKPGCVQGCSVTLYKHLTVSLATCLHPFFTTAIFSNTSYKHFPLFLHVLHFLVYIIYLDLDTWTHKINALHIPFDLPTPYFFISDFCFLSFSLSPRPQKYCFHPIPLPPSTLTKGD